MKPGLSPHLPRQIIALLMLLGAPTLLRASQQDMLDLAFGATVVTSSSARKASGSGSADALLDASTATGWSNAQNDAAPYTFVIALPDTAQISRFVIDNTHTGEATDPQTSSRRFRLSVSTVSASSGFNQVLSGAAAQDKRQEFSLAKTASAHWLKLEILSNWGNSNTTQVMELEAYGPPTSSTNSSASTANQANGCAESDPACDNPPQHKQAEDGNQAEVYWEGAVEVKKNNPGDTAGTACAWSGPVETNFTFNVRFKEVQRINVRNRDGELTGQFVVLADDGSNWHGEIYGQQSRVCKNNYGERTYAGSGDGARALRLGWIYFSLAENDPLKDTLPNGAYMLWGYEGEHFRENIHYLEKSGSSIREWDGKGWTVAMYRISRPNFTPVKGAAPFSTTADKGAYVYSEELVAEDIKAMVGGISVPGQDRQLRQLENGRMRGDYNGYAYVTPAIKHHITWDIRRRTNVKVSVDHPAKTALPKGGTEEQIFNIYAHIDNPGDAVGKFRFTLYEVSKEPGHAMNFGEESENDLDLEFASGQDRFGAVTQEGDQRIIETLDARHDATVKIVSRDYGAWGRLKCVVIVDGAEYQCTTSDGKPLTIPLDDNQNRIADYWEQQNNVIDYDPTWDQDPNPQEQDGSGDGLSIYEEYRGFIDVNHIHRRLDPYQKELFVRDTDTLAVNSDFAKVSGLTLIYIGDDGWSGADDSWRYLSVDPDKRRINHKTSGYAHLIDQHALHVTMESVGSIPTLKWMEEDGQSIYFGVNAGIDNASPATSARIALFVNSIEAATQESVTFYAYLAKQWARLSGEDEFAKKCPSMVDKDTNEWIAEVLTLEIEHTTDHEMGHGVGLFHHYPTPYDGDVNGHMRYYDIVDKIHWCPEQYPQEPRPSIFTRLPDCSPGESCYGQIHVRDY